MSEEKTLVGAVCVHCRKEWTGCMPRGFVWKDAVRTFGGAGVYVLGGWLYGYCPPCAWASSIIEARLNAELDHALMMEDREDVDIGR